MNRFFAALALLPCLVASAAAADMEITPFHTVNQSPLVQIFGLPAETGGTITAPGRVSVSLTQDVASDYAVSSNSREQISLDGESYRWTLAARYGLGDRFEAGVEIPYILYGGGFLDDFVIDWHNTFNLPQGGRDTAPKNRLGFRYSKDGVLNVHIPKMKVEKPKAVEIKVQ